jgi:hypothetical protein
MKPIVADDVAAHTPTPRAHLGTDVDSSRLQDENIDDDPSLKEAEATARLRWMHENYRTTFAAWNHNEDAVEKALKLGLLPHCRRPPDFNSAARERAKKGGAQWRRNAKTSPSVSNSK